MLLFLDLDGVLRRQHAALYRLDADCLAAFEDALRWIPDAEVVITSTWREVMPLPELRALFSEDLRGRIVGVTPLDVCVQGGASFTMGPRIGRLTSDA